MESFKTHGPVLKSFYYHRSLPEDLNSMKGLVLILHGFEDHGARYSYVAKQFNKYGYGVYSIDHIGHGLSVSNSKEMGDWKAKDFEKSASNAYFLASEMKTKHKNLPLYVLGHDFGGYFAQFMMDRHFGVLDGVILSGCGKNNSRQYKIYFQSLLQKKLLPDRNRSYSLFKQRSAHLNRPFKPTRTTYDWLSSDVEEVDNFIIDPLSGFVGTIGYYHEYYSNVIRIPEFLYFREIKKDFPLFIIGGEKDSLTSMGSDIKKLKNFYKKKKFTNVNLKLYPHVRHDIFFDVSKDEIIIDVVNWMNTLGGHEIIAVEKNAPTHTTEIVAVKENAPIPKNDDNPYLLKNKI